MSTRTVTFSGSDDTGSLLIKPADIYVAVDGVYANAVYIGATDENISVTIPQEFAEFLQNGTTSFRQRVKLDMMLKFAIREPGNIDQLALAMGIDNIDTTTVGHEKLLFDSGNTSIPDYLWMARTEFADGRQLEVVIWKGQVLNPEEMPIGSASGGTDFVGVGIEVGAIIDDTQTDNNLGYIDVATV